MQISHNEQKKIKNNFNLFINAQWKRWLKREAKAI